MNVPLITYGWGVAFNSGACLLAGGGISIADKNQIIRFNEVQYGFVPHAGSTYFLSKLPGEVGTFLALTGMDMNGTDAI